MNQLSSKCTLSVHEKHGGMIYFTSQKKKSDEGPIVQPVA